MKKILLVLSMMTLSMIVNAQGQSAAEFQIDASIEKLRTSMISGDKAELESVLSKDLSYGHSNGKVQSRADFVKIDLIDKTITVIDKTGIARHILIADTNDGGKPAHIYLGIVLVWRLEKGGWKLIARRSFHVPAPVEKV